MECQDRLYTTLRDTPTHPHPLQHTCHTPSPHAFSMTTHTVVLIAPDLMYVGGMAVGRGCGSWLWVMAAGHGCGSWLWVVAVITCTHMAVDMVSKHGSQRHWLVIRATNTVVRETSWWSANAGSSLAKLKCLPEAKYLCRLHTV